MKIWNPLAVHMAQRAHDETLDPVKRIVAMLIVGQMTQDGSLLIKKPESKPEYNWRNGARVRIK